MNGTPYETVAARVGYKESIMSESPTPYHPTLTIPMTYANLKGADALNHLAEVLTSEVERFEKETSFKVTSLRPKREKETEILQRLVVQVR